MIDNHAHSLRADFLQMDKIDFRRAFSESNSLSLIENDICESTNYLYLLSKLQEKFDFDTEDEFLCLRQNYTPEAYLAVLFDEVSLGAFLVDDGFSTDNFLCLNSLATLSGRPVFPILRLETLIESLFADVSSLASLEAEMLWQIASEAKSGLVALKTIIAYRGGFPLVSVNRNEAELDFDNLKSGNGKLRLSGAALHHYLIGLAFEQAGDLDLPVQIHCGFGDTDLDLARVDPALLMPVFRESRYGHTRFVLLHCFPFVRQAAYLGSVFANVYMDLSLASFLLSGLTDDLFYEALSVMPTSKLLAGTDGHTTPETHYLGALNCKRSLARALARFEGDAMLSAFECERLGKNVLFGNARSLYRLEGLA
ncbi:MAG: amidohydrolase family protein [Candidatus Obscuribacterales bacterium]|nr:amidohydrolase family protein [Candidatus Obscuribacterales bacterium]